ncbi:hypothetical protein LCGC14_1453690 [marine sediment metagenome]|uniref:Uncharacterized protein n=2 Tax=root TaxID=1 RepID=A0A831VT70_9FLAO|nr:hypothetical protein [Pricia antarctica]
MDFFTGGIFANGIKREQDEVYENTRDGQRATIYEGNWKVNGVNFLLTRIHLISKSWGTKSKINGGRNIPASALGI